MLSSSAIRDSYFILVTGVYMFSIASASAQLSPSVTRQDLLCEAAVKLAKNSYERVRNASSRNQAHDRSVAFWDIHELSSSCDEVKELAKVLITHGLSRGSRPPSEDTIAASRSKCGLESPFFVNKPAIVRFDGLMGPRWTSMQGDSLGLMGLPKWEALLRNRIVVPRGPVLPNR